MTDYVALAKQVILATGGDLKRLDEAASVIEASVAFAQGARQDAIERLKLMADCHIVDPTPIDALGRFDATYGDLRAVLAALTEGSR